MRNLLVLMLALLLASSAFAQHSLQLDDGASPRHYSLIHGQPTNTLDHFYLPAGGGTVITQITSGVSAAWVRGGNIVTANEVFGTTTAHDVSMVANNAERIRMFSTGGVSVTGGLTINGLPAAAGVLHNDVAGLVSSSLVVDADITVNTIALNKISMTGAATNKVIGNNGVANEWTYNGATITHTVTTNPVLASPQHNYPIVGTSEYFRIATESLSPIDLTGLSNAGVPNGRVITLSNIGTTPIILKHQNSGSLAVNQFDLPGGNDVILAQKGTATFIYDSAVSFWKLYSTN